MKILALLMCFCFTANASTSRNVDSLNRAIEGYQYSLTVEWDQKDKAAYEKLTADFYQNISTLFENGLTQEEILTEAKNRIHNKDDLAALELKLGLLSKEAMDSTDLAKLLSSSNSQSYQRGASWNGEVLEIVGISIIGTAILGYAIWHAINYKCVAYDYRRDCDILSDGSRDCDYERYCTEYVER